MDHASPREVADSSASAPPNAQDRRSSQESTSSAPGSPAGEDGVEQAPKTVPTPVQKRRRVTRACDECRRKKIKCDGKQPCTHCTVYSYDCTYDQPSNRRRNPTPQYVEALESRLQRAESILKTVLPHLDLSDPDAETRLESDGLSPRFSTRHNSGQRDDGITLGQGINGQAQDDTDQTRLESMVEATGLLELDDRGHWDYHGHSSGLTFMRRMRDLFGDIIGQDQQTTPFTKSRLYPTVIDSWSHADSSVDGKLPCELPSREEARQLCDGAINDGCALLRIVHQPSFMKLLDRIYDKSPKSYGDEEGRFLPLLYAVLALGTLFAKHEDSELDRLGYENAIGQGFKYFKASRQSMDIADCRDITSLQAIVFMILFLQSSAKMSTCYSYVGIALRAALRLGMHRSFSGNFNPIESETRKRVFWAIKKMDVYVGALLGLPHALDDDEIDQEYPVGVDDEYITETEILPMPKDQVSVVTALNAHTDLIQILSKILKHIYPIKGVQKGNDSDNKHSPMSYSVSYAKIREIEQDLQNWMQALPEGLIPGGEAPPHIVRIQQLLRTAYAHTQIFLYRPFLHYVSETRNSETVDKRSFACAAACVSVSRNVIHITSEMKKRGLLIGSYWFTMYTTFFAILTIAFFVLENADNGATDAMLEDAEEGRRTLAQLAKRSMAADRCTTTLKPLFDQLPERIKGRRKSSTSSKKRRPMAFNALSRQSSRSSIELSSQTQSPHTNLFAENPGPPERKSAPSIFDIHHLPSASNKQQLFSEVTYSNRPEMIMNPDLSSSQYLQPLQMSPTAVDPRSNPQIPDLSAMMFPTDDPFAYPTQPMTTMEAEGYPRAPQFYGVDMDGLHSHQAGLKPNLASSSNNGDGVANMYMPGHTPNPHATSAHQSPVNAQLFGPLPMYLMQGQQQDFIPVAGASSHANYKPIPNQVNAYQSQEMSQDVHQRQSVDFSSGTSAVLNGMLGAESVSSSCPTVPSHTIWADGALNGNGTSSQGLAFDPLLGNNGWSSVYGDGQQSAGLPPDYKGQ